MFNFFYDYDPHERIFPVTTFYLPNEIIRGVKKILVHDLRHLHAYILFEMGCSPILIQERLGHEEQKPFLKLLAISIQTTRCS